MTDPLVTVLTAVRNGAEFIGDAIQSIQSQTFQDWEYVIVDDASDDDTPALVEAFVENDKRLRLVRREDVGGPFAAANTGLRVARGEYIVRNDADDLSHPRRIERELEFLRSSGYRGCISWQRSFNEQGDIPGGEKQAPTRPQALQWYLLLRSLTHHSSLCIERSALEEVGGYQELPVAQDFALIAELSRLGWLGVVPEVLSFTRRHKGRISTTRGALQQELAVLELQKHMQHLIGEQWPREEIEALWLVGQGGRLDVGKGLELLNRWVGLWRNDPNLTKADLAMLHTFARFHRRRFLRANWRSRPGRAFIEVGIISLRYPRFSSGKTLKG